MNRIVKAFTKINIGINVIKKLENNYHEIDSILILCKTLYDELQFEVIKKRKIEIEFVNSDIIIFKKNNLIYKVAHYLQETFNVEKGIRILIKKNIPIGGGLGGGSSNAAVTLQQLNKLWEINLSYEELSEIAVRFGSDVPFFLANSNARIKNQGEKVFPINFKEFFEYELFISKDINVSTKKVYENLNLKNCIHPRMDEIQEKLINADYNGLVSRLFNDLEITAFELYPKLRKRFFEICKNKKYDLYFLSGSGSTIVGLKEKLIV